jgi:hypothetical protein
VLQSDTYIYRIGTVFEFNLKIRIMLPMWLFIVLIALICCLLYLSSTTEETFTMMGRNQFKRIQYWMKALTGGKQ